MKRHSLLLAFLAIAVLAGPAAWAEVTTLPAEGAYVDVSAMDGVVLVDLYAVW